ncbi:CDP-diacylglycerol diphosphatase [Mycolicibacterium lutetiense]|uniref:CDP-diacylglycerol diphosphatase n=1 Tax=Mycolicibacterium lutetiense TaxID=1641992 RepID=A0ABS4ZM00_9MYCO|nr:CDP-diacylglycerol diphosphatase [Mycolicibacterium lutetiense]MBP2450517.1 CDP-diacylglycerol pyrophosphatase [Mycolicibacterium lutetiense]
MTTTNRIGFARRFALIAAAASVPAMGLAVAPTAGAQAAEFGPCGKPGDNVAIWKDVKTATPQHKNGAIDVVFPGGDRSRGFAVREGHHPAQLTDLLVIPTARETGIECNNLLDANAPHYFKDAFDYVGTLPPGNQGQSPDWALGINSADNRGQDQLHIHVTLLDPTARADIDQAVKNHKVTKDAKTWKDSVIGVRGHTQTDQIEKSPHGYRAWNTDNIDQNFFAALNTDIVAPLKKAGADVGMNNETLLITKNHQGPGFIVLASDEKSGLAPFGVNNIERLLDKG